MIKFHALLRRFSLVTALVSAGLIAGCESKETVLDVETPDGELEVEKDTDTGEISVTTDE